MEPARENLWAFPKPYIKPEHRLEKRDLVELRRHLRSRGLVLGEGTAERVPLHKEDGEPLGFLFWDKSLRAWRLCFYGPAIHCWADLDGVTRGLPHVRWGIRALEATWKKYKNNRNPKNFKGYRDLLNGVLKRLHQDF